MNNPKLHEAALRTAPPVVGINLHERHLSQKHPMHNNQQVAAWRASVRNARKPKPKNILWNRLRSWFRIL